MKMFAVQCHLTNTTRIFASSSAVGAVKSMARVLRLNHEPEVSYFSAFEVTGVKHYKMLEGKARRVPPIKPRK